MTTDLATSGAIVRHSRQNWWLGYLVVVTGGFIIAAGVRQRIDEPYIGLTLGLFLLVLLTWLIQPRVAFYLTLFLTAISDRVTVAWFPFVKNFSSRESIAFLSDAVSVSPLDISLFLGFGVTAIRQYAATGRIVAPSPLVRPVAIFTGFIVVGLVRGVVLAGGDLRIAILESRPLFYLVLVFGAGVNILTEAKHLRFALYWLLAGVVVQTVLTLQFLSRLDDAKRAGLESLNEHGSALGQNLLILAVISLVLFRARAGKARLLLLAALAPTVFVYLTAQRRAGVAALAIAILMLLILLFWRRRRLFWFVAPITAVFTMAYLGVFWNSSSSIGFPAQAIKSIIAPGAASVQDQRSDLYRDIEAFNLNFTIRTDPIKGVGFGRPFYQIVSLPEIAPFELSAYLPHNSILWFWIKTGYFGFVAMFYMIGKAVMLGAHRARRLPDGIDVFVAQLGLLFVVMFTVYTYVDISWDSRNVVFLGLALLICGFPVRDREEDRRQTAGSENESRTTSATAPA